MYKSSSPKIWRKLKSRYRLLGNKCRICNKKHYPPVQICRKCGSQDLEQYTFKPSAKLISWSTVHAAPEGFEEFVPYTIAIVELEDGERMTTQLADINENKLVHGMKLFPTFRKYYEHGREGIIHYGIKFTQK